jgi:hypothetical protein
MVYHGAMIVVGVWLLYTQYVKLESKTILKALPVFAGCIAAAMILNEVMVASKVIGDQVFNMFYISRLTTIARLSSVIWRIIS